MKWWWMMNKNKNKNTNKWNGNTFIHGYFKSKREQMGWIWKIIGKQFKWMETKIKMGYQIKRMMKI